MSDIKIFKKALGNALFNKTELSNLKTLIKNVASGKSSDKLLREKIIKFRINIVKDLLKFFPFFITSTIDTNNFSISISTLKEDLQEKDALLKQIGQRINNIYNNLKNK